MIRSGCAVVSGTWPGTWRPSWALLLLACGATPASPPVASSGGAPALASPGLRLPRGPQPTRYALDLTVDPAEPTFGGSVDIGLSLPGPTSHLWLHGKGLTVDKAEIVSGKERIAATASPAGDELLGFGFARPVSGAATLHVVYRGKIGDAGEGLYRQTAGADRYLFTQFEDTQARRMVPCFDEPGYKVPWQLTVHAPRGLPVFSNTHAVADADEEGGRHRVTFAQTPPLPSYLLALVVGPMEIVDAGTAGARATPLRILVPRGRAAQGAYAASITGELLRRLEGYFGVPYPYDKLDNAALPEGLGAMENAGLIISGPGYLIADKELLSTDFRRRLAGVAAHEMAHQWFGDLVTMAWWDDVWLNEAFASWMGDKVFAVESDWVPDEERAEARFEAMEADSLPSARKIRQPIQGEDDIANAFDAITYQKGETVLGMFERQVGEEVFRIGVRRYLEAHAHKNATTADFVAAISAAAGRDVGPAFATFLDQPGLPAVAAEVRCTGGEARVLLGQERYVPAGAPPAPAEKWRVPVCVGAANGAERRVVCDELTQATGEIKLDRCPDWIVANAGGMAYYLARYTPEGARALAAHVAELDLAERLGVIGDLHIELAGGTAAVAPAIELLASLAKAGPAPVTTRAAEVAEALATHGVIGQHDAAYAAWVQRTFGARARAYGLKPRSGETADDARARASIVPLVAIRGRDRALTGEAQRLAARWLDDRAAVPADLVAPVLRIAAATGDVGFADKLRVAAGKATGTERTVIFQALFQFLDPAALARAAEILSDDSVQGRDLRWLSETGATGAARPVLFQVVRGQYDKLAARAQDHSLSLLSVGQPLCDAEALKEYQAFFAERAPALKGGPRRFAQTVERIQTCIAARKAADPQLAAALRGGR